LLLFLEDANENISISNQNNGKWYEVANSPKRVGGTGASSLTATRLTVFWSMYNGTQGAPTTSDSGDHQIGRIIAIRRGVAAYSTPSAPPWDVTAGNVEAASDNNGSIQGATTTVNNTLVVAAVAAALPDLIGAANFGSWTTGFTERVDNTRNEGNGGAIGVATGVKATAGAYGNTSVTLGYNAYKAMMSIAIKP
jgi:hypothetical protein